jgi:hypothetical protein
VGYLLVWLSPFYVFLRDMYIRRFGAYLRMNQVEKNVMYHLKYETASHFSIKGTLLRCCALLLVAI